MAAAVAGVLAVSVVRMVGIEMVGEVVWLMAVVELLTLATHTVELSVY